MEYFCKDGKMNSVTRFVFLTCFWHFNVGNASPRPQRKDEDEIFTLCTIRNSLLGEGKWNLSQMKLLEKSALEIDFKLENCHQVVLNTGISGASITTDKDPGLQKDAKEKDLQILHTIPLANTSSNLNCTDCSTVLNDDGERQAPDPEKKTALIGILTGGVAIGVFVVAVLIGFCELWHKTPCLHG